MIVSLEWLKDYTDVNVDPQTFCDRMIMSGSNLETLEIVPEIMEKVVVGRIEKIEKHPDADKLLVCKLNVGTAGGDTTGEDGLVQIVTGAQNVFEGAYVPVCLHGSRLEGPLHGQAKEEGGTKITKGKLRGVVSNGMLASCEELGFADKVVPMDQRDGIWILPEGNYVLGQELREALELNDAIIDFEITPNRPDCLSMIGMAREAAATFGTKLSYPKLSDEKEAGKASDYIQVSVESDMCPRYVARVATDIKIQPSPWWIQKRLMHAGMRPINNIVDITNFVMLEYGQPLHAFDIDTLEGKKIVVKEAKEGEPFVTLDGVERKLDSKMLMINDGVKPVCVAGVMGGLNSEITENTKTIVLEAANFDANSVRTTSKRLTLRTEASGRYEKGIDPNLCEQAADRVMYLIELLGAGKPVGGKVDVYKKPYVSTPVSARVSRINHVLGIELPRETMVSYLESLEMKVEGKGDELIVTAPTVRQDINIEEDIVEEVARMYGYDTLPVTIPKGNNEASQSYARDLKDLERDTLCAMGFNEIQTYSFVSPKGVDNIRIADTDTKRRFVKILNPLGEDTSVMRTTLIPEMMDVLSRNYSRGLAEAYAFEIGNTFIANDNPKVLPDEEDNICIGMYGKDSDFYGLKGAVDKLLEKLGISGQEYIVNSENPTFHPGRCANVTVNGKVLGTVGEIHPAVSQKYGVDTRVYVGEFYESEIKALADTTKAYHPLPKYPAITRDIALVVDEEMTVEKIVTAIKSAEAKILEGVKLFDIYRGQQVGEGKKSMAFSLTYRAEDRTLTDADVTGAHEKVLQVLKDKLGISLRD